MIPRGKANQLYPDNVPTAQLRCTRLKHHATSRNHPTPPLPPASSNHIPSAPAFQSDNCTSKLTTLFPPARCRLLTQVQKWEVAEGKGKQQPTLLALFGTLYTLAKEKYSENVTIALATVLIDFVLVTLLFIRPEYPDDSIFYKYAWYIEFHQPVAAEVSGIVR